MFDNIVVQVAVSVILVGYVGFTTYKSLKTFITYRKQLPDFLKLHKDASLYTDSPLWWILTSAAAGLALFMVYFTGVLETSQIYFYRLAYLCIAIIFLGLAMETYVRKRVYLIDEGIFYVDRIYRYRMMAHFEVRKGIVQNIRILMNDKETIEVSKKMGTKIRDAKDAWKKQKKDKKR